MQSLALHFIVMQTERDLICFRLTDHVSYITFTVGVRLMVDLVRTVKKLL